MEEELPRRKDYYSISVKGPRDEVFGAYKSIIKLRKNRMKKQDRQVFVETRTSLICGITIDMGLKLKVNKLTLRFGRSQGDKVKGGEVEIESRKDVKFTKVIHVLMTYDKKLGLQASLPGC